MLCMEPWHARKSMIGCAIAKPSGPLLCFPHCTTTVCVSLHTDLQCQYLQLPDEGDVWVVHDDKGWAHIPEQPFLVGVERCKADTPQQGTPILLDLCTCTVHGNVCISVVFFGTCSDCQSQRSDCCWLQTLVKAALKAVRAMLHFSKTVFVHACCRFRAANWRRRLAPCPAALLALLGRLGRAAAAVAGLLDQLCLPDEGLLLALAARTRQYGGCSAAPVMVAMSPSTGVDCRRIHCFYFTNRCSSALSHLALSCMDTVEHMRGMLHLAHLLAGCPKRPPLEPRPRPRPPPRRAPPLAAGRLFCSRTMR
jgi:hypothetical protein